MYNKQKIKNVIRQFEGFIVSNICPKCGMCTLGVKEDKLCCSNCSSIFTLLLCVENPCHGKYVFRMRIQYD